MYDLDTGFDRQTPVCKQSLLVLIALTIIYSQTPSLLPTYPSPLPPHTPTNTHTHPVKHTHTHTHQSNTHAQVHTLPPFCPRLP